jgi:TonB family protein
VVFKQGQKQLADSTVNVARGGRAVVGGTDGDAAPYIFVFVEPEVPGEGNWGGAHSGKEPGITQPVLEQGPQPVYPAEAKNKKITGTVLIDLLVGTDGKVEDAMAIEYPELSLAQSAIEALKSWKFQPAHDEKGNPLRVKCTVEINFKLK